MKGIVIGQPFRDGWQPSGAWLSTRGWPWEVKSEPMEREQVSKWNDEKMYRTADGHDIRDLIGQVVYYASNYDPEATAVQGVCFDGKDVHIKSATFHPSWIYPKDVFRDLRKLRHAILDQCAKDFDEWAAKRVRDYASSPPSSS